jgi:membrane protein
MMAFLRKLGHAAARDALDDVGAMMAFYAILAVFPMVFFVVTLAALVLPAHTIAEGAGLALDGAPITTRDLFASQIDAVTSHARPGFAFGTVVFAVWGASRGASGLMLSLNKLFGRVETRSWLRRQAIAIALTLGVAVLLVIALGLLVAGPLIGRVVGNRLGLGSAFAIGWAVGRWMFAWLLVMVVWALAYRFLPDTDAPFRIFTPGAVVSVGLWLAISRLFGLYFDHLGSYTPIYGALGSAVISLMWLWLSSMSLLFGAEINEVLAGVHSDQSTSSGVHVADRALPPGAGRAGAESMTVHAVTKREHHREKVEIP